jgi:transcriptional regulator with XRE-family HTH domain
LLQGTGSAPRRRGSDLSSFVERLRQCLLERGMSQADLARGLGIGVATVSEWFTRGRVPNGDVMLRLPAALQVSGHWLLTGEGPRDLDGRRGTDPYLRGVQDALTYVHQGLEEAADRFGVEGPTRPPPEAAAPLAQPPQP